MTAANISVTPDPVRAGGVDPIQKTHTAEIVEPVGGQWDSLIVPFADMCLEQSAAYMLPRWGASRLCGLILRDAATLEISAAALAVIVTIPLVMAGLAYVKFGPLWRGRGGPLNPAILFDMLMAIRTELAEKRGLLVRIMPPADPDFERVWKNQLAAAGYSVRRPLADPDRYLVDLTLSPEEQLASLGAKWRANLNKTHDTGIECREVSLSEGTPQFMALYRSMLERKRFLDHHRIGGLPAFVSAAPSALGLRMFIATASGQPVAASLIAGSGDRVFVPFSATNELGTALRAGYALRWWIMERLRGTGTRWLDIGGDEGDAGLRHFKEGNVGKRGRIVKIPGEYDYSGSALSSAASGALELLRSASQTASIWTHFRTANAR